MSRRSFAAVPVLCLGLLVLHACAGAKAKLDLRSEPPGAEVLDHAGGKLGETPLTIEGDKLVGATDKGYVTLEVRKPGYEPRTLIVDSSRGLAEFDLRLKAMDESYFSQTATKEFTPEINAIARELLGIQGLIVVANVDEAEQRIRAFQEKYPLVAAGYVLKANLALMRGQKEQAKGYLLRAQELDSADTVITRMLRGMGVSQRSTASDLPQETKEP